jgi:THO complex subunit 7
MTNVISEDDIIKKRLLIEGDSGNDDRLINKLCRNFVKWTNGMYNKQSSDDNQSQQQQQIPDEESSEYLNEQILACLAHIEFGLVRNQFVQDMNKNEQENYQNLYVKINSEIEKAKRKIQESKAELQEARKVRKNRQEYDILAKQIIAYPDRNEMKTTIKNLEEKLESLKNAETDYDRKLDLRRKQFQVVLHSLSSMKNLIENDTKLEEYQQQNPSALNEDSFTRKNGANFNASGNNIQELLDAKINSLLNENKLNDMDDLDDDNNSTSSLAFLKREKHHDQPAEVEMEES